MSDVALRLPLEEGDPGWWGWAEKSLWYGFCDMHPEWEEPIMLLTHSINFESDSCADPVLTSGVQVEGIRLRVAELLGLVVVDRS